MSLTSYRAAPPRDPEERHNAGRIRERKNYREVHWIFWWARLRIE